MDGRRFSSLSIFTILIVLVAFLDCGGGSGSGGDLTSSNADPNGDWQVTTSQTSNTCDNDSISGSFGVRIAQSGSDLTWFVAGEVCGDDQQSFSFLENQAVSVLVDEYMAGSCLYRDTVTTTLNFTSSSFTGDLHVLSQAVSGTNCNENLVDPCEIRATLAGSRCQGCYTSCAP